MLHLFRLISVTLFIWLIASTAGLLYFHEFDFAHRQNCSMTKKVWGFRYNQSKIAATKLEVLSCKSDLDVLVLGSSRVMQFRDIHFPSAAKFYNLGLAATDLHSCLEVLEQIPDSTTKLLIIGIDHWWMNSNWDPTPDQANPTSTNSILKSIFYFTKDLPTIATRTSRDGAIGIDAIFYDNYFRPDGSRYYGEAINFLNEFGYQKNDSGFQHTFERIELGIHRFEPCLTTSYSHAQMLAQIAQEAKSKARHTIYFLPPFAPSVNEAMIRSGNYPGFYQNDWQSIILSEDSTSEFFDFSDAESEDSEYFDGFHGGEEVYRRIAEDFALTRKSAKQ